jgi:uncharacterized protein YbaR (Trm112 family)
VTRTGAWYAPRTSHRSVVPFSREECVIDKELLEILCCPETKQPVAYVDGAPIEAINEKINAGGVKNRAGESVTEPIDAGLVREDQKFLYPIRQNIPIMLIDEAIPYEQFQ